MDNFAKKTESPRERAIRVDSNYFRLHSEGNENIGYVREADKPSRVIVLFRGGRGTVLERAWLNTLVPDASVKLILLEYPNISALDRPSFEREFLKEVGERYSLLLGSARAPVYLLGESFGGAVATMLCNEFSVSGLALLSPSYRLQEVLKSRTPKCPIYDLFAAGYWMAGVSCPLYILGGDCDTAVSICQFLRLFRSSGSIEKSLEILPGVSHNIVPEVLRRGRSLKLVRFLQGV